MKSDKEKRDIRKKLTLLKKKDLKKNKQDNLVEKNVTFLKKTNSTFLKENIKFHYSYNFIFG